MSKKRILLTNFHPKGGGGHITYLLSLLHSKLKGDYEIGVAAPETSRLYQYLQKENWPHLYACDFPAKIKELGAVVEACGRFRKVVSEFKPDVVHANGGADLSIVLWSHPACRPFAVVRTHHAVKSLGRDPYHRWIYSRPVQANIYVSESSRQLSQARGLRPRNSRVIVHGLDLEYYRPVSKDEKVMQTLGLQRGDFVFGSCAGLGPYKRVDLMLAAAVQLKGRHRFRVVVLGEESQGIRMCERAKSLGLEEVFVYAGYHRDVRPFISVLDAGFILSDAIETSSYASREMLAMGKPLVSSSFSGLKENVVDGSTGFLVRPGNVEEVAAAMERFLVMGSGELGLFASNARSHAEANFDIKLQIAAHDELYRSLAGG